MLKYFIYFCDFSCILFWIIMFSFHYDILLFKINSDTRDEINNNKMIVFFIDSFEMYEIIDGIQYLIEKKNKDWIYHWNNYLMDIEHFFIFYILRRKISTKSETEAILDAIKIEKRRNKNKNKYISSCKLYQQYSENYDISRRKKISR